MTGPTGTAWDKYRSGSYLIQKNTAEEKRNATLTVCSLNNVKDASEILQALGLISYTKE